MATLTTGAPEAHGFTLLPVHVAICLYAKFGANTANSMGVIWNIKLLETLATLIPQFEVIQI